MAHEDQDFFDTGSLKNELSSLLPENTDDIFPSNFRRFLTPTIPDPHQLSIPSEPTVRGSFIDRIEQGRNKSQTLASLLADIRTTEKVKTYS